MSWDGGWSGSGAVIVGFHNGDRIARVSPDSQGVPITSGQFLLKMW